MKDKVEIFKALGDETRLRILSLLFTSESLCCCEITDSLEGRPYNISRHLKILCNVGLVETRKEGRWTYFSPNRKDDFIRYLSGIFEIMDDDLLRMDHENLMRRLTLREGGKCVIGTDKKRKENDMGDENGK